MPLAHANGVDLYYEVAGEGPWLIFAHGGEGCHLHWWNQVVAFRSTHRCLTYDARGFGLSGGEWGDPEASAASDLLALMDVLDIRQAVVVGQSMGGIAAAGIAQRAPERLRGIVMGDTPFGFSTGALSRWAADMLDRIPAGFNVFEHLHRAEFSRERPEAHYLYEAIGRLNSTRPLPSGTGDYLDGYVAMRDAPAENYSNLGTPALFIVGESDELTPVQLMTETAKAVGNSPCVVIPGAGHSAFAERPELYNAALGAFLSSLP